MHHFCLSLPKFQKYVWKFHTCLELSVWNDVFLNGFCLGHNNFYIISTQKYHIAPRWPILVSGNLQQPVLTKLLGIQKCQNVYKLFSFLTQKKSTKVLMCVEARGKFMFVFWIGKKQGPFFLVLITKQLSVYALTDRSIERFIHLQQLYYTVKIRWPAGQKRLKKVWLTDGHLCEVKYCFLRVSVSNFACWFPASV